MGGCAFLSSISSGAFQRPTLTFESWSPQDLGIEGVTIALKYRLENPNGFGLDLRSLGYKLEVEGRRVVEGQLPAGVQVRARGATPIAIPVRLRWRELPGFVEVLLTRPEVAYRVTGQVGVGSPVGVIPLPFDHSGRVPVPRPPAFQLEGISVRESSLSAVALDLKLRIQNRNAFPLPLGPLAYALRVGERELLSGASHPLAAVPASGQSTIAIPVRISSVGAAQGIAALLRGADVRLRGLADFGGVQLPVDALGRVR